MINLLQVQWIFRNKHDENGLNKVRLVAKGYNQEEEIDYDETYALFAWLKVIRMLLAYTCVGSFKLLQNGCEKFFV